MGRDKDRPLLRDDPERIENRVRPAADRNITAGESTENENDRVSDEGGAEENKLGLLVDYF